MAASSRVICVQIDRPPSENGVETETPEQRLVVISQCLQKAEEALESGDIEGFFDYFKAGAKSIVNKAKQKATEVYKRVQDIKPGYKVELPERFFGEMDALVNFMERVVRKIEQGGRQAPGNYPLPPPPAPQYNPPPPPPPPAPEYYPPQPPRPPQYYPPPPPPAPEYYPPPPAPQYYPPPPAQQYYPPPPAPEYYPAPQPPAPEYYVPEQPSAPEYYPPPPPGYYDPSAPPYPAQGVNPATASSPPRTGQPIMYYLVKSDKKPA